ncbi:MAG: DUF559 domain-containing protein [Planctomycetaceae bacterium]|nr:DUF559 domain-containing protein [Planctomycetaceae bacterium]
MNSSHGIERTAKRSSISPPLRKGGQGGSCGAVDSLPLHRKIDNQTIELHTPYQSASIPNRARRRSAMTEYFNQSDYKRRRQTARRSMPPAEAILWSVLKGRKLLGCKFRRQYGVGAFQLDFYCAELLLGIELDGETHYVGDAQERDRRRQKFIESLGIRMLRGAGRG